MKGTMMIEIEKYTIFSDNKITLQELSKDDSDKANVKYMTNSQIMAVDFNYKSTSGHKYSNITTKTVRKLRGRGADARNLLLGRTFQVNHMGGDSNVSREK